MNLFHFKPKRIKRDSIFKMADSSLLGKLSIVLLVILAGILSITSSIQNIQGVEDHRKLSYPLTSKQLDNIFVYSVFNLVWACLLLPSYLVLIFLRKEHLLPLVSFFVFLCNSIRIILYYTVTATTFNVTFRYLAFYNADLEVYSFWFLSLAWLNGCVPK